MSSRFPPPDQSFLPQQHSQPQRWTPSTQPPTPQAYPLRPQDLSRQSSEREQRASYSNAPDPYGYAAQDHRDWRETGRYREPAGETSHYGSNNHGATASQALPSGSHLPRHYDSSYDSNARSSYDRRPEASTSRAALPQARRPSPDYRGRQASRSLSPQLIPRPKEKSSSTRSPSRSKRSLSPPRRSSQTSHSTRPESRSRSRSPRPSSKRRSSVNSKSYSSRSGHASPPARSRSRSPAVSDSSRRSARRGDDYSSKGKSRDKQPAESYSSRHRDDHSDHGRSDDGRKRSREYESKKSSSSIKKPRRSDEHESVRDKERDKRERDRDQRERERGREKERERLREAEKLKEREEAEKLQERERQEEKDALEREQQREREREKREQREREHTIEMATAVKAPPSGPASYRQAQQNGYAANHHNGYNNNNNNNNNHSSYGRSYPSPIQIPPHQIPPHRSSSANSNHSSPLPTGPRNLGHNSLRSMGSNASLDPHHDSPKGPKSNVVFNQPKPINKAGVPTGPRSSEQLRRFFPGEDSEEDDQRASAARAAQVVAAQEARFQQQNRHQNGAPTASDLLASQQQEDQQAWARYNEQRAQYERLNPGASSATPIPVESVAPVPTLGWGQRPQENRVYSRQEPPVPLSLHRQSLEAGRIDPRRESNTSAYSSGFDSARSTPQSATFRHRESFDSPLSGALPPQPEPKIVTLVPTTALPPPVLPPPVLPVATVVEPVVAVEVTPPPPPPPPAAPTEIYERIVQVGEGTYGKVYKAKNLETGELVALKRIRMEAEKDGFPVTAIREIKLLQSLRHPNVVDLIEMMVSKGHVYMVFEYMGHDLTGVLHHPSINFTPAHLKSLMQQLLSGLGFIHRRGVLHRDLKGSNLLISRNGELKIADFGLARFYQAGRGNEYTNRVITQWYKPPELLFGATIYGSEVDMWSAGCIFLELFARRPVFQGQDEIHQLEVIFKTTGTPTVADWPTLRDLPWYELVKPRKVVESRLREVYSTWLTPGGLDVAEKLLYLDPAGRPDSESILRMPYFTTEEPLAELPELLSAVKGEWHEYESKKARKRQKEEAAA